jgi:alpha-beta hydrolase superfamily lysophospholipase
VNESWVSTLGAVPVVFQPAGRPCFGWFHPARAPARGMGVLLCRPIGYEALCAYQTYKLLAMQLAEAGFDVFRFDYDGTGDSAGEDADPGRVAAWVDSTAAAAGELKRLAGVSRLALFGLRLGATIAAETAARMGGVDSLVLWAPCTSGRALARELRAANACRAAVSTGQTSEDIEALACLYTAETLEALQQLDCERAAAAPAHRALVIARDDMPMSERLPARYRELGVDTTVANWPGYKGMMAEPHEAVLDSGTLTAIVDWLVEGATQHAPASDASAATDAPQWPDSYFVDGIRETPVAFGPRDSLFGILSEPAAPRHADRHCETAVLLLNVGGHYRIGPNRMYVKAARALAMAGYRALRFDRSGIGDSPSEYSFSRGEMYSTRCVSDVRAAIDALAARGCKRFHLMGLCSGSYSAFQTALADPRVSGQVLMNSRLLEWNAEKSGNWQNAMLQPYKSTHYYRRAMLHADVYSRLLRGQINIRGIAGRIAAVLRARVDRTLRRVLGIGASDEGVLKAMKQLCARGTDTLMIMSAEDDGRDYVEFHLGRHGCFLRNDPNFRFEVVEDSDHTFSTRAKQRVVIDTVLQHLDQLHEQPTPPARVGARVAVT